MRTLILLDLHHLLILEIFSPSLSDKADVPLGRRILRQNEHAPHRSMPDGIVVFSLQEIARFQEMIDTKLFSITTGCFISIGDRVSPTSNHPMRNRRPSAA
jgi:hypothetical protein